MSDFNTHWILEDKTPVPCDTLEEWAMWFEKIGNRRVFLSRNGDKAVSTVFLGLDHNFDGGTPLLFETLADVGGHDDVVDRYETWEQAERGHIYWCDKTLGIRGCLFVWEDQPL